MSVDTNRRRLLASAGALGLGSVMPGLGLIGAHAQTATDYKALVCVFLYGGNDGANTIIPAQAGEYAQYQAARPSIAVAQNLLVPLASGGQVRFGLHPNLAPLQAVWDAGKLGVLFNVGPLLQPTTRAQFVSSAAFRPANLLSHDDQQRQWQSAVYTDDARHGWGGLVAERVQSLNAAGSLPVGLSVAGNDLFLNSPLSLPVTMPAAGAFGLEGFGPSIADDQARLAALRNMLSLAQGSNAKLARAAAAQINSAVSAASMLNGVANATSTVVQASFQGLTSGIATQLLRVAKIIEGRGQLGARRQIFFVSQGGYDTHGDQIARHNVLLRDLGAALRAFYNAMSAIGTADMTTTFTLSDFGRTLKATTDSTDHGWGNHHFIMGGAVRGGQTYGTFPSLALGAQVQDSTDNDGRFIPTTSIDQYGATLAQWFGVAPAELPSIFPNLNRFAVKNLAFMV
jgi:uncharacterized protein (DUF1501 family)